MLMNDGRRDDAAEVDRLRAEVAAAQAELARVRRRLARSEAQLARMTGSITWQLGRTFVDGARHPARAAVTVPRDLTRLWRRYRTKARVAATDRVVPIALPPGARRRSLTMTAPPDMLVPRRLAERGLAGYEPESMACFLAQADVAGPGAVFDIGANVGIFAALASALTDRRVVAFEPAPELVAAARRFAADNRLGFTTEPLALGAENGTATFYLSDSSDTSNSLAEHFRSSSAQITVPVETLDDYVARTGVVPAVLKVDTETTEPDVIAGAVQTITEHRPWILCEVLANRVEERLTEVMAPLGYHWYPISEEIPFQEAYKIVGDHTYRNLNWLFAPRRPDERFWSAVRERLAALRSCTARPTT